MQSWTCLARLVFAAVLMLAAPRPDAAPRQTDHVVFHDVHVVDVETGRVVRNQTVRVDDGRISAVEPAGSLDLESAPEALVIEGRGRYLMPGLADMHVHHTMSGAFPEPEITSLYVESDLALYLIHGITTVRNMAGLPGDPALAERIREGKLPGPRFVTTGPPVLTGGADRAVKTPSAARREVAAQARAGFDFVKVYCCFRPESHQVWSAMVIAAEEAGLPLVGHVPKELPFAEALQMASIEHLEHLPELFEGLPETESKRRLTQLAESGVYVTPTLVPFASPGLADAAAREEFLRSEEARYISEGLWKHEIKALEDGSSWYLNEANEEQSKEWLREMMPFVRTLHDHGVPLLTGSDSGGAFPIVPGFALQRELELLVESGLSPAEVLRAATVNAARFLGETRGLVKPGLDADLVLLEGNPLDDISATQTVVGVMVGRTWLDEPTLEALRESLHKR